MTRDDSTLDEPVPGNGLEDDETRPDPAETTGEDHADGETADQRTAEDPVAGTPGGDDFRASVRDARARVQDFLVADRAIKLRFLGDLVALAPLVALLWWMASHDGGNEHYWFRVSTAIVLLASPVAALELRDVPRPARLLLGWYGLGLVVALAFAGDRNEWVATTLTLTTVPLAGLFTHRIWRRPWGPSVLLLLVVATFGRYWYRAFLSWWGDTLLDRVPVWRPLSWHNQSAMLMGAFGVAGLGVAAVGRRFVAGLGVAMAAGGLAGAWLAGSRGALVATVLAGSLAILPAVRARGLRGVVLVAVAGPLAAVAVVAGLTAMVPEGAEASDRSGQFAGTSTNPLENRTGSASGNFRARLKHMEAAVGMALDDPLTGEGPGSYRRLSLEHTPPDANLTSSAHNEYLESLAEGGLVFGGAFIALHLLVAFGALRALWRREEVGEDDTRRPLQVGMALALLGIGAHVAIDFDWVFPVLPILLAVAAATMRGAPTVLVRPGTSPGGVGGAGLGRRPTARALLLGAPLVLLLAAAVAGSALERQAAAGGEDLGAEEFAALPLPWQGDRLARHALDLSRRGEHELAASTIQEAMRWNPDVRNYRAMAQMVLYRAGSIDGSTLAGRLDQIEPGFGVRNLAIEAMIDEGDLALASRLAEGLLSTYPRFEGHGIDAVRSETWYLRAEVEAVAGDCDEATAQIQRSLDRGDIPVGAIVREFEPLTLRCPELFEGLSTPE